MSTYVRCLALAGLGTALSLSLLSPGVAADNASACGPLTPMQASVVGKADEGVDALRRYVFITRGIHQLDITEVAGSLDGWKAQARCAKAAAEAAKAQPPVALQTPRP